MKKIGLLVMALVLAMGMLGVGYAAWTDTVTIDGTVNTGNVDLQVVGYSSTWVYKVPGETNDIVVIYHDSSSEPTVPTGAVEVRPNQTHPYAVAYAIAEPGTNDDEVTITYVGLFPSIVFRADILLHYAGSIPVNISVADFILDPLSGSAPELLALYAAGKQTDGTGAWIEWRWSDNLHKKDGALLFDPATGNPLGIQLEYCDYILIVGIIHLPQDDALMSKDANFSATFTVKQWNEP
ncbi:hypothetical protein ES703_14445 [subsurface metagenome]